MEQINIYLLNECFSIKEYHKPGFGTSVFAGIGASVGFGTCIGSGNKDEIGRKPNIRHKISVWYFRLRVFIGVFQ